MVAVKEHTRAGSTVRGHNRDAPGAKRELSLVAGTILFFFAVAEGGVTLTTPSDATPQTVDRGGSSLSEPDR